jgi:rod shape-determining protein MreD
LSDSLKTVFSVIVVFIIYVFLSRFSGSIILSLNLFSLVVIYFACAKGEIYGALLGTCCGLIYDSFSLGVFGVAGLSKSITGYLAGYISSKVDMSPFLRNFVFFLRNFVFILVLLSFELFLWFSLYTAVLSESVDTGNGILFFQPFVTAIIGSLVFSFLRKMSRVNP